MPHNSPPGLTAIAAFLIFGAAMASFAGTTLAFPGTILDRAWSLNPVAHAQLLPLGPWVGVLFFVLAAALAVAAAGWLRRRYWGWALSVTIIAIQVLGDLVSFVRGDFLRGGVGVVIAGALLFYMTRPGVRGAFQAARR
jgi:hypothetical protein